MMKVRLPLTYLCKLTSSFLAGIPQENAIIQKPVFFGAALRDYIVIAPIFIEATTKFSNNKLTIHEYDTGHWVMLEAKDRFNSDLLHWIEGLGVDGS